MIFFLLTWLWASWWMGDVMRIAYEHSFIAADSTLMLWLWQRSFGPLWIVGRALLALYRWPLVGGLLVAALLTLGSWLLGYCLQLTSRWRWIQYLPAAAWMIWTAHVGLNLFYMHEPGRILAIPFLCVVLLAVCTIIRRISFRPTYQGGSSHHQDLPSSQVHSTLSLMGRVVGELLFLLLLFALPMLYLTHRHPYLRPLTHMQVQLLHDDFEGMSRTAHKHAEMSYRQIAGYYVIALARTGHLADQLFDIKLNYVTPRTYGFSGNPSQSLGYHLTDCNYYAGMIRAARHSAVEDLTMNGPTLSNLKIMVKISLVEGDWEVARKYLHVISKTPFEGAFLQKYEPMVNRPDLVQADPEFAAILSNTPAHHVLENMYEKPCFVGYYAVLRRFRNLEDVTRSAVACLYSKRMPDFLRCCSQLIGTSLPRSIAEGLVTQAQSNPAVLKAFPQLQMDLERYGLFLQAASPYMHDRELGAKVLFEQYHGYYPYYYFFGNLGPTREDGAVEEEQEHNKAGVN